MKPSNHPPFTLTLLSALLTLTACTTTSKTTHYDWVEVPSPVRQQPAPPPVVQIIEKPAPAFNPVADFAAIAGDRVYFDTDRAVLRPEAKDILNRQVAWLTRHPEITAHIEGNTDERGGSDYNYALGVRRAEAVRDYLVKHGIAASRLTTVSYGKTRPIEEGRSVDALARNRNAHTILTRAVTD